jgi:hypothetical protein
MMYVVIIGEHEFYGKRGMWCETNDVCGDYGRNRVFMAEMKMIWYVGSF